MTRISPIILCAVVIVMLATAGCFGTNTNPPALVTPTAAAAETAVPATTAALPAGTTQPGAAGTAAAGTCTADTSSDAANCGGCGYACPANAQCEQGQCYCKDGYTVDSSSNCVADTSGGSGCPAGMSPCPDGYCYELASSASNCGICGNQCSAGMICSASTCTNVPADTTTAAVTTTVTTGTTTTTTTSSVGSGLTLVGPGYSKACLLKGTTSCSGVCVNLSTSTSNCGSCGKVCKSLAPNCCGGTCVNYQTDSSNCGSCGHKCSFTSSCIAGSCQVKAVVTGVTLVAPKVSLKVTPIYQQPGFQKLPGI